MSLSSPRGSPGMRLACDECHVRKLRCSRNTVACTRCICNGIKCSYSPARKVGRRKKADRSMDVAGYRHGPRIQMLKSMGTAEVAGSSPPAPLKEPSLAPCWADLGGDGYGPRPWQGLWTLPLTADEAGWGDGDGSGLFDGITMAVGSESFANNDIWWDDTNAAYSQMSGRHGAVADAGSTGDAMGSENLLASSAHSSSAREGASSEEISGNIQRLAKLQQDLFVHRTRMSDTAGGSRRGEGVDIDAVISVGQAILELTRSLFACSTPAEPRGGRGRSDGSDDPARILLALTPSLLVVTTYNDILHLISRALREMKAAPIPISPRCPRGPPRHHAGLYGKTLPVGRRDLDFPVRLILSMTLIDYHLGPLYQILQLIRSRRPPRPRPRGAEDEEEEEEEKEEDDDDEVGLDSSCEMLAPSIEGLWSATQGLRQRVGKLIEQAKMVDTTSTDGRGGGKGGAGNDERWGR